MEAKDLNILLIDDLETSLKIFSDHLKSIGFNVFPYLVAIQNGDIEREKRRACDGISKLVNGVDIHLIIADRGYFEQKPSDLEGYETALIKNRYFRFDDLLDDRFELLKNLGNLQQLQKVIIFTYDKDMFWFDVEELENSLDTKFGTKKTFVIETSTTFLKPGIAQALYWGYDSDQEFYHVSKIAIEDYSHNFANALEQIIYEEVLNISGTDRILPYAVEYDVLGKLKALNATKIENTWALKKDNQFKIGHLTYITDLLGQKDQHLLDVPRRDYFHQIDKGLEEDDWTDHLYKDNNGKYLFRWFCFFDYEIDCGKFHVYNFHCKGSTEGGRLINYEERRRKLLEFIPILHASVFYDKRSWGIWPLDTEALIFDDEKPAGKETIKLFFLFSGIQSKYFASEIDEFNNHINYSFWRLDDKSSTISEVEKEYKDLYQEFHLSIQSIAENGTFPAIRSEILLRNLLDNFSHTIFNTIPNIQSNIYSIEEYLTKIDDNGKTDLGAHKSVTSDISVCRKQFKILEISLRAITGKEISEIGESCLTILQFLEQNEISTNSKVAIDTDYYDYELDVISREQVVDAYLILWNLWHNASKCKAYLEDPQEILYEFQVKLFVLDNRLAISFRNIGVIQEENIDFLLNSKPLADPRKKGIKIIKERMLRIGWEFSDILTLNGYTEIIIKI